MVQKFLQLLLSLGFVSILLIIIAPPEVDSRIRIVRQKPTPKPGAGKPTSAKPGAKPSSAKPSSTTTVAPGGSSSTTAKPGSGGKPTTAKSKKPITIAPVDGGEGTVTEAPSLLTVTQLPILTVDGFTYLTQIGGQAFYISDETEDNTGAIRGCRRLERQFPDWSFALAGIEDQDLQQITDALLAAGADHLYVDGLVTQNSDGDKIQVRKGLWGRYVSRYDDDGKRRKRETDVLVTVGNRYVRSVQRRQAVSKKGTTQKPKSTSTATPDLGGVGNASSSTTQKPGKQPSSKPSGKKPGAGNNAPGMSSDGDAKFITVLDTLYPWMTNWTQLGEGQCADQSKCPPTTCEVTTPACTIETRECTVKDPSQCKVLEGAGNCSMDCEKCEIEKPTCFVQEPKCIVKKDRACTVTEPGCEITTFPCTVTRPECVSRQPPCNISMNSSPNCTVPQKCLTEQAITCVGTHKDCTEEQKVDHPEECELGPCQPWAICIKPDYCREEQIMCPPIETFCPPEIVKCPPPKIKCGEPEVTCQEPELYCGPPTVACTRPLVNCTAPKANCPNIVTVCPNPVIDCPPPTVTCPPPQVVCKPPDNPCPVTRLPGEECIISCTSDCHCFKLIKHGDEYKRVTCKCDEINRYVCEAGMVRKESDMGRSGGGKKQTTAKPVKKG